MDDMSFFDTYKTFEERVEAAIAAEDIRLVQVLLGPKYCQLWQLWLIHGIVASKVLNMELIVNNKLLIHIADKQIKIISDHIKMLENRKDLLKSEKSFDNNNEEVIKSSRHLFKELITAVKDSVAECRDTLLEEVCDNELVNDYRSFYIHPQLLDNSDVSDSEELSCFFQEIISVSRAERLTLDNEIDNIIKELSESVENSIWQATDSNTKCSYYLDKLVNLLNNTINKVGPDLTKTIPHLTQCSSNSRVRSAGAITVVVIKTLQFLPEFLLKLHDNNYNNSDSLKCVESKLKEMKNVYKCLEDKVIETKKKNFKIQNTCSNIKSKVLDKLNDGKFIDKQFVKDKYISFLYNYLDDNKLNETNLIYNDLKIVNGNLKILADQILNEIGTVNLDTFDDILHKELMKEVPNFDVISLFLINSTPLKSYRCITKEANNNLNKLMKKSHQTIMIDMNNLLFDFESHVDSDLMMITHLPNRDGTYTQSCSNNIVLLGSKPCQDLKKKVQTFSVEIERLIQIGGLNRTRGCLPSLFYFFYDLYNRFFSEHVPSLREDEKVIHDKIREFYIKVIHSIATENEGMVKEYLEDINNRLQYETNNDVKELYRIILGKKWSDIFKGKYKWKDTPQDDSLQHFMRITNKQINAFKLLEVKNKSILAIENAKVEASAYNRECEKAKLIIKLMYIYGKCISRKKIKDHVVLLLFERQKQIVADAADFILTQDQETSHQIILEQLIDRAIVENL